MNEFGKVLKVNALSIIALPLLLFALIAQLLAKATAKLQLILGAFILLMITCIFWAEIEKPGAILNMLAVIVVLCIFIGVIVVIMTYLFAIAISVFNFAVLFITALFEGVHGVCFMGYETLFNICREDYDEIKNDKKKFLCPLWWGLKGISWLIAKVISLSLVLASVTSVGIIVYWMYCVNKTAQQEMNLSILGYWKSLGTSEFVIQAIMVFIIIATIVLILFALGIEWSEWGKELLQMMTQYDTYIDKLFNDAKTINNKANNALDGSNLNFTQGKAIIDEKIKLYMEMYEEEIQGNDLLSERVNQVLKTSQRTSLATSYSKYLSIMQEIANDISKNGGHMKIAEVERIITKIKELCALRKTLDKELIEASLARQFNCQYFNGCNTQEALDKRYRQLCKTYHPDQSTGDQKTFVLIKEEYDRFSKQYKNLAN